MKQKRIVVQVLVNEDEKKKIKATAKSKHLSVSSYIRTKLFDSPAQLAE